MIVPINSPPIIVTAKAPNISSFTKGIIPKIVVIAARNTGRKREVEASTKARKGSPQNQILYRRSAFRPPLP